MSSDSTGISAPTTQSLYDQKIHGDYYPLTTRQHVPDRYDILIDWGRRYPRIRSGRVVEIGAESPAIPEYWSGALSVDRTQIDLVEISSPAVNLQRHSGFRVTQVDVSCQPLPFQGGAISAVFLLEVLEHLLDPDYALSEVHRVLRDRGVLILSTPNLAFWFNRVALTLGWQPMFTETGTRYVLGRGPFLPTSRPVGHLRVMTSRAVDLLLRQNGFRPVIATGTALERELQVPAWVRPLDRAFSKLPALAAGTMIMAERVNPCDWTEGIPKWK